MGAPAHPTSLMYIDSIIQPARSRGEPERREPCLSSPSILLSCPSTNSLNILMLRTRQSARFPPSLPLGPTGAMPGMRSGNLFGRKTHEPFKKKQSVQRDVRDPIRGVEVPENHFVATFPEVPAANLSATTNLGTIRVQRGRAGGCVVVWPSPFCCICCHRTTRHWFAPPLSLHCRKN